MPYTAEQQRLYTNEYRAKRREEALSLLGGRCSKCGSTEDLQFDHIRPFTKKTSIGRLWTASKSTFYNEISLCQLLCSTCHKVKNKEEFIYRGKYALHGTEGRYNRYGCRCELCKQAKQEANYKYRQRQAGSATLESSPGL